MKLCDEIAPSKHIKLTSGTILMNRTYSPSPGDRRLRLALQGIGGLEIAAFSQPVLVHRNAKGGQRLATVVWMDVTSLSRLSNRESRTGNSYVLRRGCGSVGHQRLC